MIQERGRSPETNDSRLAEAKASESEVSDARRREMRDRSLGVRLKVRKIAEDIIARDTPV